MVHLIEIIKQARQELLADDSIQRFCYEFVTDRESVRTLPINLDGQEEFIAAHGYTGLQASRDEIEAIIARKPIKGIDFTTNIYKLLGIHLASNGYIKDKLEKKFQESSLKYKYLICRVLPEFNTKLEQQLRQSEETSYSTLLYYLYFKESSDSFFSALQELINQELDVIDLLILEDIQRLSIELSIPKITILSLSAKDLALQILHNFGNTVKKITRDRRKGHANFEIKDEYDVQDILYVMFKPIFPKLVVEDPTPKVGVKYNRIDLGVREEGIVIEAKMIKDSDNDEKEFIGQLKDDIQSYYRYSYLKDLIIFVYDPQNKTKDVNAFYDLNGTQEIQGIRFNIEVIVGN